MVKVLLVDDSWVARLGMNKLLVSLGHSVSEVSDGLQALELLKASPPDVVFLDLLMPGLDGFGVLQALGDQQISVPVFVLSADIQETTLKKCRDLGARGCLPKPPTREAIEVALRTLT